MSSTEPTRISKANTVAMRDAVRSVAVGSSDLLLFLIRSDFGRRRSRIVLICSMRIRGAEGSGR